MPNLLLAARTLIICCCLSLSVACGSKPKDADIQNNVNAKLTGLSGVSASVGDGVVTLTGVCPDEACRSSAESRAKEVEGVKSVVNNITITPPAVVEINGDDTLTTGVNNIIKDYSGVTATVSNGEITLTGDLQRSKLQDLMMKLSALKPKKINNQLVLK